MQFEHSITSMLAQHGLVPDVIVDDMHSQIDSEIESKGFVPCLTCGGTKTSSKESPDSKGEEKVYLKKTKEGLMPIKTPDGMSGSSEDEMVIEFKPGKP